MHNASLSFSALLQNLSSGDSNEQLIALTELCEVLSLSTEEQLGGFRVGEYVRALVNLLEVGASQEIMLLAARAITNLLEVLPASAASIASGGGVTSLCNKLLMIDSIDVAEQALLALSKLSLEQPSELLREGALTALMQNVVFFPTNVQRTAFVVAANIVQEIYEGSYEMVMKSAPLLLQHLEGNTDEKTISQIFLFFSRVTSQTGHEEHLALHASDFTNQACHALKTSSSKASLYTNATVNLIVTSLLGMCQSSPTIALALLQMEMVPTISALAVKATGTLLHELLALALELLPEDSSQPPDLQLAQAPALLGPAPVTRLLSEERPYDPSGALAQLDALVSSSLSGSADFSALLASRSSHSPSQGLSLTSVPFVTSTSSTPFHSSRIPMIPISSSPSSDDSTPSVPSVRSADISIPFFSLVDAETRIPLATATVTMHADSSPNLVLEANPKHSSADCKLNGPLHAESDESVETKTADLQPPATYKSSLFPSSSSFGTLPSNTTSPPARESMKESPDAAPLSPQKLAWFKERPAIHTSIAQELLLMFVRACNATANASIRHLCVRGVLRITLSTPSLESALAQVNMIQFAANLLQLGMQNSDYSLLSAVIIIIDALVTKLASLREEFVRGGVTDKLRECARTNKCAVRNKHFSPFMSPYSSPGQSFSLSSATASSVQTQAQACLRHFSEEAHTSTQAELALKALGQQLKSSVDACSVLTDIKNMLAKKGDITAHELVRSDVAKALVEYVTQAEGENQSSKTMELQDRQRLFCHVFFGLPTSVDFCSEDAQIESSVLALSEKISQNTSLIGSFKAALEAVEQFVPELYEDRNSLTEGPGSDSRIELLGQPFKIKLSWKDDEPEPSRPTTRSTPSKQKEGPAFPPRVVLADALASIRSIENYLLSQEAISALFPSSVAAQEGKKKKGKEDEDEVLIREAKKAFEISSPIHLGFEVEGLKVSPETSILKAIQLSMQSQGGAGGDCKTIWDKTYDVQFFKTVKANDVPETPRVWPSPARSSSLLEKSLDFLIPNQPVDQLLQLLRCCYDLSQQWPLLYNMSAEGLVSGFNQRLVSSSAFVSEKLSKRVQMQIEDPVAVCGGCFPAWCVRLCQEYPFMLNLSVRRLYFKFTAFNTSQHLHSLEAHLENSDTRMMEGSPRIERESSRQRVRNNLRHRIQQLKLRVHRANVLEVSCDLMEGYAKRRGFIRAEFIGEEGVGVGPTLELFALVSQKIQQRKLRLWFDQDAVGDTEQKKQVAPSTPQITIRAALRSSKKSRISSTNNATISQAPFPSSSPRSSFDRTRAKDYYRLGVCVCRSCHFVEIPQCSRHGVLLSSRDDGQWSCPKKRCGSSTRKFSRQCKICDADREIQEWLVSTKEAAYIKAAFPAQSIVYPHTMLRCPRCWCVNFPGTETMLTINRGGQIVTHTGRIMQEKDYRLSTQHLTSRCTNSALENVPLLLSRKDATCLVDLLGLTSSIDKDSSLSFHDDLPSPVAQSSSSSLEPYSRSVSDVSLVSSPSSSPLPSPLDILSARSSSVFSSSTSPFSRIYSPSTYFPQSGSLPPTSSPASLPSYASFSSMYPSIPLSTRLPLRSMGSSAPLFSTLANSPLAFSSPLSSPSLTSSPPYSSGVAPTSTATASSSPIVLPPSITSSSSSSSSPSSSSQSSSPSSSTSPASFSIRSSQTQSYLSLLQSNFVRFASPTPSIRASSPLPEPPLVPSRASSRSNVRLNSIPSSPPEEPEEYVRCSCGLFPSAFTVDIEPSTATDDASSSLRSVSSTTKPRTRLDYFRFVGRLMGQALLEDRLLDIPFSGPLLQLLLGQPLQISSLLSVNPFVGKSMVTLDRVATRLERSSNSPTNSSTTSKTSRKRSRASHDDSVELKLLGCPVVDLVLDFTVPGHPNMELKPNGANCSVTSENLREYVNLVCSTYLYHPRVQGAISAIRQGLGEVVNLSVLSCFSPIELQELLCGGDSETTWDFSVETLKAHVVGRQGYSSDSRAMQWLFSILSEFTGAQQRGFVRFVTGSPRLPVGGLKSLKPPLSIIRVQCVFSSESSASCTLPSAMTCSSYLKLPDYPSKEIMKQKLLYRDRKSVV